MGQKVKALVRPWDSRWFAKCDYAKLLHEDIKLREYLKTLKLFSAGIARIRESNAPRTR